jgi:DNA-binding MarR family transcriptional regulator
MLPPSAIPASRTVSSMPVRTTLIEWPRPASPVISPSRGPGPSLAPTYRAADSGLSESDYDVLSTLTEKPEPRWRASELAARLLWSSSRLAHHVGRMERRGLVARQACDDDGRGAVITLTDAGRAVLREAAPHHVASVRRNFIDLLTDDEVDVLARISAKVIEHLAGRPG